MLDTASARPASVAGAAIPLGRKISYGAGAFGISGIYSLLGQLLLYYYTDVYGLKPAEAGLVLFVAAMWDALIDPVVAWITSQTNTRYGRYRPYLIFGSAPVSIAFVLMFLKPAWAAGHLLLFALFTQMLFRTLYQGVYLPYTALIAQLSTSAEERSTVASYKAWFVTLGQLAVAFFGLTLVRRFGAEDPQLGFIIVAVVVGAASCLFIFQTGAIARETETAGPHAVRDVANPLTALSDIFRNRQFLLVATSSLVFTVGTAMLSGGLVYIFQYDLGRRDDARMALSALFFAGLLATPVWAALTRRHGKRLAWVGGSLIAGAMLLVAFLARPRETSELVAIFFVYGLGLQGLYVVMFASTADAVDYGEWLTGRRTEALSFGLLTFFNKSALAIAGGLLGGLLAAIGFQPNHAQSAATLDHLRWVVLLGPAAFWFATAVVMSFYTLSNARHAEVRAQLEARRKSAADG